MGDQKSASLNSCPATATEFNGERMICILERDHIDAHTDGCVTWNDPWSATGEVDVDQHALWLRDHGEPDKG